MPPHESLEAVSRRRELLGQAIVGLEDALTAPVVEGSKWRLRVAMAVDHAMVSIDEYIRQAEATGGLLDRAGASSPRLARRVNQFYVDHERLTLTASALRRAVDDFDERYLDRDGPSLRKLAIELIGQLGAHRERSAELTAAYETHITESGLTTFQSSRR